MEGMMNLISNPVAPSQDIYIYYQDIRAWFCARDFPIELELKPVLAPGGAVEKLGKSPFVNIFGKIHEKCTI